MVADSLEAHLEYALLLQYLSLLDSAGSVLLGAAGRAWRNVMVTVTATVQQ
jgi:hypothetical protein